MFTLIFAAAKVQYAIKPFRLVDEHDILYFQFHGVATLWTPVHNGRPKGKPCMLVAFWANPIFCSEIIALYPVKELLREFKMRYFE